MINSIIKRITFFWDAIFEHSPFLAWVGSLCIFLFALLLIWVQMEVVEVDRGNIWVVPAKFALSVAIYVWTIGFFISYFSYNRAQKRRMSIIIGLISLVVVVCTLIRSFLERPLHFTTVTFMDTIFFLLMGGAIFINALILLKIGIDAKKGLLLLPDPIKKGVQFGVMSILMATVWGSLGYIIRGDAIEVPIDGAWLTILRCCSAKRSHSIAQILGIYGFQIIPLVSYLISNKGTRQATVLINLFGGTYIFLYILLWLG